MGSKNRLKKRQALAAQRSKRTTEQDRRREARPVYRLCCRCWRSWNVSRIDPPGKQTYLCPDCRSAPWEGCVRLSLGGYGVPAEEIERVVQKIRSLDIRAIAQGVMQQLFHALEMRYAFTLGTPETGN